ncbi:MAG: glycoside hydrolase family 127 protein [Actinobacteria bacterium]|nr:glycoside hydrolase family 127 protein [Actinomycetota bacterium]
MKSKDNFKIPVSNKSAGINDAFWGRYIDLVKNVVIPYQWDALNDRIPDAEPSHVIENFKIAAGLSQGEFYGIVFRDSDLAKWLEAVGFSLAVNPDAELEKRADEVIDIIAKAQQDDGYLNTYFTIKEPDNKWTNLRDCHELYCAGHMMEAAVAYFEATGKRKLLDVMCKFADLIDTVFGTGPDKKKGYPGHEEIELALVKLYRVTGEKKYLDLSKYFIDERGKAPNYFIKEAETRGEKADKADKVWGNLGSRYCQAHLPVREQTKAEGHSVRAVYLYSGMADVALETGDQTLIEACKKLWRNIVSKRMYITGGIGSTSFGESFTFDYDLPNNTIYAETCASIGLVFFAHRMLQMDVNNIYSDIMEKALYNSVISGISLDGKKFFYVNPLEVWPEASEKSKINEHVKVTRQSWFGCACCPPNISRLLASIGQYIYSTHKDEIYTHLYINGETEINVSESKVKIKQETRYPWDEKVKISVSLNEGKEFSLLLRIPGWCDNAKVYINREEINISNTRVNGYAKLKRIWRNGDVVELVLPMVIQRIKAHPNVRVNIGKVALQRGPVVYCLEEIDNGPNLHEIVLPRKSELKAEFDDNLLGGLTVINAEAQRYNSSWEKDELYKAEVESQYRPVTVRFIPYYSWANRTTGEMMVWITER